jgi:YHS domain-containing protein
MHTIAALALSILFVSIPASAQAPQPLEALDGVDTVILLHQGKEVFGKSELSVVRGRFRYLFSTAETKSQFEGDPARYEIQLGGMCARMGGTATGTPGDYFVHDGKIYIFGSDACHKAFAAAPAKYLAPTPAPMPASPQALQRGLELLNRLAEATGRQQLDNLVAYAETASQVQKRLAGPMPVTTKTTWRFPSDARIDRTMERNGAPVTFSTVVTPSAMWNAAAAQNRTFPIPDAARPFLESSLGRHPGSQPRHSARQPSVAQPSNAFASGTAASMRSSA